MQAIRQILFRQRQSGRQFVKFCPRQSFPPYGKLIYKTHENYILHHLLQIHLKLKLK